VVPSNVGQPACPFKLVVPPLARRGGTIAAAEYLVPPYFTAGGIGSYPYLLGRNRQPVVSSVQDPDTLAQLLQYIGLCKT
jgi:hypothetical protein